MMLQNLYIFNFKQYLIAIVLLIIFWFISAFLFLQTKPKLPDEELFDYQISKLNNAETIDTIFLGDSSLGNAINAKLWEKLSGEKTLNLALTGVYGYEGAYVMLLNTLSKNKKTKNVLLFFEPQQMLGNISYAAFLKSPTKLNHKIPLLQKISLYWKSNMNPEIFSEKLNSLFINIQPRKNKINSKNDYIAQKFSKRKNNKFSDLRPERTAKNINPKKFIYLKKISDLCKNNNINCIYIHGTIVKKSCKRMKSFIKAGELFIRNSGLKITKNNFFCTPDIDMGDSPTHLHPEVKNIYTKKYFNILKNEILIK